MESTYQEIVIFKRKLRRRFNSFLSLDDEIHFPSLVLDSEIVN